MTTFAMVFPGQGSQRVGMLAEIAASYPNNVKATFAKASAVLDYDLLRLVEHGPAEELNNTWQTQPALLTASVVIWQIWQRLNGNGTMPMFMAGHSLGEYSALVCAGVLDFSSAVKLVALRGMLMHKVIPTGTGAMSAIIGLDNAAISAACEQAAQGQIVSPANFNSPGQVVIAGHKEAVERASIICKAAGAKRTQMLSVSVPSHCILMKPAAKQLAQVLETIHFSIPQVPVVNNVDVCAATDPAIIRQALVRQLYSPVRWTETIEYFSAQGIDTLLEIGPGKVLTGFTKRIINTLSCTAVQDKISLATVIKDKSGGKL
ncbi:[acyl-carrier-protein] S-malonyltransferase [Candidatus Palibaumannia cicadellinicola]|uniref:Malonyl CoA-acyl carrier protein transacylase n=1 Tax=Candidatus Palibaumannia cicadellinicola TaxID=186490 RepID=A0A2N4XWH0_9GAMM|nr:ACP S-malonyltransferase [Candidatus Baumannia cicadellinicola]PLK58387.1 [acyl-carrier-protein] S-malonyltransferase [Candidatus Baumannia cicadellinicola]